jgi:uncharacterized membrane protein
MWEVAAGIRTKVARVPAAPKTNHYAAKRKSEHKEKTMEDLIVVAYDNQYKAQDTLNTLRSLNDNWMVNLYDAVAVSRNVNGTFDVLDSYKITSGEGAGWGILWGTLIGGLIFAPFTGGMSAAAAAGTVAAGAVGGGAIGGLTGAAGATLDKDEFGLSEDFVYHVSEQVKPGNSAIFALADTNNPDQVANFFRGTGGTILRTTLTPQQQGRVQQVLAGAR